MSKDRLRPPDAKVLQQIVELWRALDQEIFKDSRGDGQIPEGPLMSLKILVHDLSFHADPDLQRLGLIAEHLHPGMGYRSFLNFLVPFERMLGRQITDSEIFVTHQDRRDQTREVRPLIFCCENIRSAFNVGSIFRLADAVGCEQVDLCGYTPTPDQDQVRKTSLGSEAVVPWKHYDTLAASLAYWRERGYRIIAMETALNSIPFYSSPLPTPTVLVVGNERFGLDLPSLHLCDEVRSLPQVGLKNSVNVAVALGAAAFEWQRQWGLTNNTQLGGPRS